MDTLLIIGLIFALISYSIRIIQWILTMVKLHSNYKETEKILKQIKMKRIVFTLGGIEHLIIFASILGALIVLW